jgi:hypothetical protein
LITVASFAAMLAFAPVAAADHTLQKLASPAGGAPYDWTPAHMSPDGQRIIFETDEPLDPADTDTRVDLYEAAGEGFSLLNRGDVATGLPRFADRYSYDFSLDGSHVFYQTTDSLVPEDRDFTRDVYDVFAGDTRLVSAGDLPSNGLFDSQLHDASEDGTRVYFSTEEKLVAEDTDGGYWDVYERSPAGTRLVSIGPSGGSGEFDATFQAASRVGSVGVFTTQEQLVPADTDTSSDLYASSPGSTELVSTGPADSGSAGVWEFVAMSRSGDRIVFTSFQRLVSEDSDGSRLDIYARTAGTTTLISTGPTATNAPADAIFGCSSEDATQVFFHTAEQLTAGHTWTGRGYYRGSGATTDLVVPVRDNSIQALSCSGDGSHAFYRTLVQVLPNDTDPTHDVYQWHEGVTTRVSTGPQDNEWSHHSFAGASFDGERVFFSTRQEFVPEDLSPDVDIYERYQGQTFLLSVTGGTIDEFAPALYLAALGPDGTQALLAGRQTLDPADTDDHKIDAYLYTAPAPSTSFWRVSRADDFGGGP